jgi:hypothetical protein
MVVGAALAAWAASRWSAAPLPLTLTLVGTGTLLVILGLGLRSKLRAAWSFSVSVLGVLAAAGLLATPGVVRAGVPPVAVGLSLAAVAGLLFLLISGRDQL